MQQHLLNKRQMWAWKVTCCLVEMSEKSEKRRTKILYKWQRVKPKAFWMPLKFHIHVYIYIHIICTCVYLASYAWNFSAPELLTCGWEKNALKAPLPATPQPTHAHFSYKTMNVIRLALSFHKIRPRTLNIRWVPKALTLLKYKYIDDEQEERQPFRAFFLFLPPTAVIEFGHGPLCSGFMKRAKFVRL